MLQLACIGKYDGILSFTSIDSCPSYDKNRAIAVIRARWSSSTAFRTNFQNRGIAVINARLIEICRVGNT